MIFNMLKKTNHMVSFGTEKIFDKSLFMIRTQQSRSRSELPQFDKKNL